MAESFYSWLISQSGKRDFVGQAARHLREDSEASKYVGSADNSLLFEHLKIKTNNREMVKSLWLKFKEEERINKRERAKELKVNFDLISPKNESAKD